MNRWATIIRLADFEAKPREQEKTMTYYYYKDHKGEWRWRLKASNGRIIADSAEGYSSEEECKKDIDRVKGSKDAAVKKE